MESIIFFLVIILVIIAIMALLKAQDRQKKDRRIYNTKRQYSTNTLSINTRNENEQKGDAFEGYVTEHFDKKYFKLIDWRSDKRSANGQYAQSAKNPDLVWEFRLGEKKEQFAVECKYRSSTQSLTQNKWATEEKIKIYNEYSEKNNIPVFIVFGIGGEPSNPENIYVIPLKVIQKPFVYERLLKEFEHSTDKNFYYNLEYKTLN